MRVDSAQPVGNSIGFGSIYQLDPLNNQGEYNSNQRHNYSCISKMNGSLFLWRSTSVKDCMQEENTILQLLWNEHLR